MKKIFLLSSVFGLLMITSCNKKETVVEVQSTESDTMQVTQETVTEQEVANPELKELEIKLEKAKQDLNDAIAKGDKKAEEVAQKALSETKKAWENLAEKTKKVANDAKTEANKAGDKIDNALKETGNDIKKGVEDIKKDL